MFKLKFSIKSQNYLSQYFKYYREYYENLYSDSGLWNEDQIIKGYFSEATKRKNEIIELIKSNLSENEVLGKALNNTLLIPWRKKIIFIEWVEKKTNKTRYIKKIELR